MKVRAFAFLGSLALTIVAAIVGNVLEAKGILTREKLGPGGLMGVGAIFFGLFCLICFTIVPLALRFFIMGQIKIGNGDLAVVKWLRAHENTVVFAVWGMFFAGLVLIVALTKDQFLKDLM